MGVGEVAEDFRPQLLNVRGILDPTEGVETLHVAPRRVVESPRPFVHDAKAHQHGGSGEVMAVGLCQRQAFPAERRRPAEIPERRGKLGGRSERLNPQFGGNGSRHCKGVFQPLRPLPWDAAHEEMEPSTESKP
jgi:hypothetical protein